MTFNNMTLTILGLAMFIGFGASLWYYSRRPENVGLSLGVIVKKLIIQQNSTLYLVITTLFISGESMMAASAAGEDGRVSVLARLISHVAIGALAFIGALSFIKTISNFAQSIMERNVPKIIIRFLMLTIIMVMALLAPVANTILLAHAFHQSAQLHLFYLDIMRPESEYFRALLKYGLSLPYSSWSALHNAVAASVILNIFGFIIIVYESLEALATMLGTGILDEDRVNAPTKDKGKDKGGKDDKKKADEEEDEESGDEKKDDKGTQIITSNLEKLVTFFYGSDQAHIDKTMKLVNRTLATRDETENVATGFSAAVLIKELAKVDPKNAAQVTAMKDKIKAFMGGSKNGNKNIKGEVISPAGGLGIVLQTKK